MLQGELKGGPELMAAISQVEEGVAKKVLRTALRAGAKIIAAACRSNAPVGESGATKASIKVRAGKRSRTGMSMLVRLGEGDFKGKTFYAGFVNYGWHLGKRTKAIIKAQRKARKLRVAFGQAVAGDARKFVPGTHWLNKSFDASAEGAQETIVEELRTGLAEEIAGSKAAKT